MKYISINLYRKMMDWAIAEGLSPDNFNALPTPYYALERSQAVPADEFFELHEMLDERLGPGFSIRVGQQMKIEDYGVLGLSWRTCSWAGEIFERSERYFKLLSNTYDFKVDKKEEYTDIYLLREPYRRGMQLSNEATLSATVVVLKAMTETNISPVKVSFKHRPPKDLSSYTNAFNCPIAFNDNYYSITYKTTDIEIRTAKADASINTFLVQRVEEETKGLKVSGNRLAYDVQQLIKNALPSGIPSVHHIGEHLCMSNRTLTRRLSESGMTYRDLIKKTQEQVATGLLTNTNRSIAQIAFETGFSEQSAFNRAFKRWKGVSPTEFRKNNS